MTEEPWFRLKPSKLMAGLRGLSPVEIAVYLAIICRIMEHSEPVEDDREILATYCAMRPTSFNKAFDRLLRLRKLRHTSDGRITNAYCEEEISWRAKQTKSQSNAGKKSADKRQQNQGLMPTPVEPAFNHKERDTDRDIGGGGSAPEVDDFDAILIAAKVDVTKDTTGKWYSSAQRHQVEQWVGLGLTLPDILDEIASVMRGRTGPPSTLAYFTGAMQRRAGLKAATPLQPIAPPEGGTTHGRRASPAPFDRTQRVLDDAIALAEAHRQMAVGKG